MLPDEQNANGAATEPVKSLRTIAEEAYDSLLSGDDSPDVSDIADDSSTQETGQDGQPRDTKGRFVAREPNEPGEADAGPTDAPAPQESPSATTPVHPAPEPGRSSEPPQHWPASDREMFAKQTPEAQAFILRRHSEMERDHTQKTTAAAQAVDFVSALAPVYEDQAIAGSLQQAGVSFVDAIHQWASVHKRAMDPNPQVRFALLTELAQRMGVDPAAVAQSRPGPAANLTEEQLKDPTIRFIADNIGKSNQRMQMVEQTIKQIREDGEARQREEAQKVTKWGIDTFASEKDASGQPLRPHFDAVLPQIIELFKADPKRDLAEAYQTALWMNPQIRTVLVNAERTAIQQQASNERARQAVRSNLRGRSAAATAPADNGQPKSLRQTLEEAADEVGI